MVHRIGDHPDLNAAGGTEHAGEGIRLLQAGDLLDLHVNRPHAPAGLLDQPLGRRRALREKEEARRQAVFSLLEDLLPVLDNFKLGLKAAEQHEGGAAFIEGFRIILAQMEAVLRRNGLEEFHPLGDVFDPNFHESIAHLPHPDIPEGHIVEVHRTGYKHQERLLRPAAVVVSSGPPAAETAPPAE